MAVKGQKRGRYKVNTRRRVELRLIDTLADELDELAYEHCYNNRSALVHILLLDGLDRVYKGKLNLDKKLRKLL